MFVTVLIALATVKTSTREVAVPLPGATPAPIDTTYFTSAAPLAGAAT
ncbi:hypothetical protein Barb6_03923 [Bacteroidales bacterium Barb6]|nr:hypothetical protein Barb6_03923 [Bacteroidales bacterium Barb6]